MKNNDADQTARLRSLVCVFVVRFQKPRASHNVDHMNLFNKTWAKLVGEAKVTKVIYDKESDRSSLYQVVLFIQYEFNF